jgi:sulfur carrier protein ThiS
MSGNAGSMATVTVKVTRWLCQHLNVAPPDPDGIPVAVSEGESVRGMLRRLAADGGGFWEAFLDAQAQEVGGHVLVILNGLLVNPADRGETLLRDGDQVLLLPMVEGG